MDKAAPAPRPDLVASPRPHLRVGVSYVSCGCARAQVAGAGCSGVPIA